MTTPREVTMRSPGDPESHLRSRSPLHLRARAKIGRSIAMAMIAGATLVAVAGCSSGNPATVGTGHNNGAPPGDEGGAKTCLRNEPGCACPHEGTVVQCGVAVADDGGKKGPVKCAMGGEICTGGTWSTCETNANDPALQSTGGLKLVTGIRTKGLTNPGVTCVNDPCDPYCIQYPDNADGLDAGEGGVSTLGCGDASVLTVVTTGSPEASVAPVGVLKDAGLADGEGYIFIDLPTNQTASRAFTTPQATIKSADVYFLIDDTSSMGPAASNLASALAGGTNNIIAGIKAALPDNTYFGVGRFEDYYQNPYVGAESATFPPPSSGCNASNGANVACINEYDLPYQHLLSMQSDILANTGSTANAVNWLTVDAFNSLIPASQLIARSGGDIPEATVAALWMMSTGNGVYAQGTPSTASGPLNNPSNGLNWWQVPRADWTGSPVGVASMGTPGTPNTAYSVPGPDHYNGGSTFLPCGTGSVATTSTGMTWPCFRNGSTPVIVLLSDAPGHEGPGGQYPHVNEVYTGASPSPHLLGANAWPNTPIGGCPTGYGGTTGNVCNLTTDPLGDTGTTFATAIALPPQGGVAGNPPLNGVYYGIVPNSPRAPGSTATPDWFSASSVGSGVFNINTSALTPGYPQRNSLRDCSATDNGDECTPSLSSAVTYPPTCWSNTTGTVTGPTASAAVAAGNSTYTPATTTATAPTQALPTTSAPSANALPPPYAVSSMALTAPSTVTGVTLPTATTPPNEPIPNGALGWTSTPVASYAGWTTVTIHTGSNLCVTSDQNGTYATCNNASAIAAIPLAAGEGIQNVTITITGESQESTASLTGSLSGTGYTGSLTTGTVVSTNNTAASSSPTGVFYAGAGGATVNLSVIQSFSPNNAAGDVVQFEISYQTNSIVPASCSTELVYGAPNQAECPTCSGTGVTYSAGNNVNGCWGPVCPGTYPTRGTAAGTTNTCYQSANCATVSGFAGAWQASTSTCTYTACTAASGYPNGPVANKCYQACGSGTWSNAAVACTYTCANVTGYPNAGTGANANLCYAACTTASDTFSGATGKCTPVCSRFNVGGATGYTYTLDSGNQTCYACELGQTPALTLNTNNWLCDSCTGADAKLDIKSGGTYECDSCSGGTVLPVTSTATTATPPGIGTGTYNFQCPGGLTACATGYTGTTTCTAAKACINTGPGATGAGCPGTTGTLGVNGTYITYTLGNTASETVADPPGNNCTCTKETTVTAGITTYASTQCGANASTVIPAGQCSTAGEGSTCGPNGGPATLQSGATCTTAKESGGWVCQETSTTPTASCAPNATPAGEGYFGNDIIYSFQVPAGMGFGSRYYYHFALLRQGPDSVGATKGYITGDAPGGTTGPQANVKPFLYIKSANGFTMSPTIDSSYPYTIPVTASASDSTSTNGGPNGPVLDCNVSAMTSIGEASNPSTDYIVSEVDGYLPAGSTATTYYLVIDNAISTAPAYNTSLPKFQYFLQVGGFDDNPTNPAAFTQPSYDQMIPALKNLQAQFVGVENSGLSCLLPTDTVTQAYAQYETRDFMEKIAYDLGSYDPTTNHPYVVPVRKDGTACAVPCPLPIASCALSIGCPLLYPSLPNYDPSTGACVKSCTTNADCPMNTPTCHAGGGWLGANYCTSGCAGGISGLSCAVASAVANLTDNLKQNVYLRPIAVNSGATYTPPGSPCTPTTPGMPASMQCTGPLTGGTECYGSTCTTTCNVATDCASGMCEPSTYPGDTNKYCISPAVFVQSVQALSTTTTMMMVGSQTDCGIHPKTIPCALDSQCPANLPTCLTDGPGMSTCGINDTGPDNVTPQPSYYNASDPPQDNDGMFNFCSPGSQVVFNVTFIMPYQRSSAAQQYEFDLGIYAGAGLIGRTRVILENPALEVSDFYRYYDGNTVCGSGTHVVWGIFSYNAICPSDGEGDFSQIRFCATTSNTSAASMAPQTTPIVDSPAATGCAPGEVLVGIATAATTGSWKNTCPASGAPGSGTITGFNVGDVLQASGAAEDAGLASEQYLRIRMEFDPSTPGDVVAPFLYSWNLDVDCVPSE